MDNVLKIASMNCRGIGEAKKRRDVFGYLRDLNYSFYLLQDTHFTPSTEARIKSEWGFHAYFSSFSSNSRGVAILVNNNVEYKLLNVVKDINGNFIILHVNMFEKEFLIVNIYGPNNDSPEFYVQLEEIVERIGHTEHIIFGGDWNLVRNFELDCCNYLRQNNVNACKQVDDMSNSLNLVDIWRELNPSIKRYTWRRPTPVQQSRLDYFLITDILAHFTKNVDILPGYRSDHSLISLTFAFGPEHKNNTFWKFNTSLLNDNNYLQLVNNTIKETIEEYAALAYCRDELHNITLSDITFTITDQLFLEVLLMKIRANTISFSFEKNKSTRQTETKLIEEIERLERLDISNEENKQLLEESKEELVRIREHRMKGVFLRSRARWVENGEKVTKYFCGLEKRNYINKSINKLELRNGECTRDKDLILSEVYNFYNLLYTKREVEDVEISGLVEDMPVLSDEQANSLEGELTLDELSFALKEMKHSKSPGSDGFPSEFFKVFWRQLGILVLRSLNEGYRKGELSTTQKEGVIICLPKTDTGREKIKNWRPITLLNTVYKLASTCIANRLKTVLPLLIHEDQTGFMQNRYIGDNIRLIYDIINHLTHTNSPGLLLCLDFEKAFDSLDWSFLVKVLIAFGFKEDFCKWIATFYQNIKSSISLNGNISRWFEVGRGCRQGDPISPYIFILCAEVMAIMLRENLNIKGIKINDIETKITQYADDSEILLEGDRNSFEESMRIVDTFGRASGLNLNVNKTNAIWLGSKRNSDVKYMPHLNIVWNPIKFKILGIWFTNDLKECLQLNLNDKFAEIRQLYKIWSKRQLTPLGRIAVLKSLILSKLIYLWMLLPNPPDNIIDDIQSSILSFIWNKKNDKIKRNTAFQNIENGGIGIPDLRNFIKGLKITWIRKIRSSNHKWNLIFLSVNPMCNNLKYFGSNFCENYNFNNNMFWNNVFADYKEFYGCIKIESIEDFLAEPIFHNKMFNVNGSCFYFDNWFQKGVHVVNDLYDSNTGNFLSFQEFTTKFNIQERNFLKFNGCINTIRMSMRKAGFVLDRNLIVSEHNSALKTLYSIQKGSKLYYDVLISKGLKPKYCTTWENKLTEVFEWKKIFDHVKNIKEKKLQWFQIRVMSRILGTNVTLFSMNMRNDNLCTFCLNSRESIEHIFCDCTVSTLFWDNLILTLKNNNLVKNDFVMDKKIALFGFSSSISLNSILYYVVLLARFFIYRCRCEESLPTLQCFLRYLTYNYKVLLTINMKKLDTHAFVEKWSDWLCVMVDT